MNITDETYPSDKELKSIAAFNRDVIQKKKGVTHMTQKKLNKYNHRVGGKADVIDTLLELENGVTEEEAMKAIHTNFPDAPRDAFYRHVRWFSKTGAVITKTDDKFKLTSYTKPGKQAKETKSNGKEVTPSSTT
jgi:hypothetical protein